MTDNLPAISVVVIGRNEGDRLVRCLESVREADYPPDRIELVYVDTDSTDNSCETAEQLGAKVVRIKPSRPSAAGARNAGFRSSSHDLVHFLDGDTILDRSWFRKATAVLNDPTIACTFGRREEIRPRATLYMRVASLDWHVPAGLAKYCGGDALFRRSVLEEVGGFNESLIAGEEPELCCRIRQNGLTIWRCDEPMTQHDLNMSRFRQYWRRAVRSGWAYMVIAVVCHADPERLWRRENVANVLEVSLWLALLVLSLVFRDWSYLAVWLGLLAVRTAWIARNVRDRTDGWGSSLLYAFNCQFMRIPLLVGQVRGMWFLLRRRPARLIEYKD